jgi:Fic family protein
MTKFAANQIDSSGRWRIDTHRSGPFTFEIGINMNEISSLLTRVEDAYDRFYAIPLINEFVDELESISLVSAIYGTNTIEGATFTEKETEETMNLTADRIQNEQQQRVINLQEAYKTIKSKSPHPSDASEAKRLLTVNQFKEFHKIVCKQLSIPQNNTPGEYRKEIKSNPVRVGDAIHGGVYTPPKCHDDIIRLTQCLAQWANHDTVNNLSPLLRAPLVHYYFERIHPFQDGNGRVGRLIEAWALETSGYHYVSKAINKYYLNNINKYYLLFNECRKEAEKKSSFPNTPFIQFFLEGMLDTINYLQDKANSIISWHLLKSTANDLEHDKIINSRQAAIFKQVIDDETLDHIQKLARQPWYIALYKNLNVRTKLRDLKILTNKNILSISKDGKIKIDFIKTSLKLHQNPRTSAVKK